MELTAACNAKCPGCFPQYLNLSQKISDLELTKRTITSFAENGGKQLTFTARGEPLLDKRIASLVEFAKNQGCDYVEFTSNGQLLTEATGRALIESGLDTIRFSVTGSTQDIYKLWQGYESTFTLEQVEGNILRFINLRNVLGSATPKVFLRYIYDGSKDDDDCVAYLKRWVNHLDDVQFTLRLPVIKGNQAVKVANPADIPSFFSSGDGKAPCPAINPGGGGFSVTSDGVVTLCPSAMGEPQLSVGNLVTDDFADVSTAFLDGLVSLRERMLSGQVENLPEPCQSCFAIVEGGNNCQDFDILLMMTVAELVNRAAQLAMDKNKDIVIVGATTSAMMMLLNGNLRKHVKAVLDADYVGNSNPYAPEKTFKNIPVHASIDADRAAESIFVVADDPEALMLRGGTMDCPATTDTIRFSESLKAVNGRTFNLPDVEGVYAVTWSPWHTQMQQNFYFWYLKKRLQTLTGSLLISSHEYYIVDKLMQRPEIVEKTDSLFTIPGATAPPPFDNCKEIRGKVIASFATPPEISKKTTLLVWTNKEAVEANKCLLRHHKEAMFEILNYQELARDARLLLAFGAGEKNTIQPLIATPRHPSRTLKKEALALVDG